MNEIEEWELNEPKKRLNEIEKVINNRWIYVGASAWIDIYFKYG